jgi:hypothetical protein
MDVSVGSNPPVLLEKKPKKNMTLELTFMAYELEDVLLSTKVDSCLGQDGLPILFFKKFWGITIGMIISLLWRVDVARLNFEILTLTPIYDQWCRDSIKQFRQIVLINLILKFIARAYTIRLAPLAHRPIEQIQMAFSKGKALHEGVLALYKIAHEQRKKKLGGLFLLILVVTAATSLF